MAIPGTIQFPALAATPSPPPVGSYILYVKTDNTMYLEDSSGNVYAFGSVDFISELTGDVTAMGPGAAVATVTGIQGHSVSNTAPTDGQFLVWVSGSAKYVPTSISGDISFTDTGVTTVVAIQGYSVSSAAPTDAQILIYNGISNKYFPESISGDATLADTGVITLSTTAVTGKLLTGYTTGINTPITATNSILTAFENLQAQVSATSGSAITALTGDVSATGPGSVAATIEKIQGTTVSGTTGTGNVVFSASPTLTGTLSGAAATFTSTIGASNLSGTNTGDVTTTNTNSIDLSFTSGQSGLNATLNLSAASPDAGYIPAVSEIKTDGLLVEVLAGTPVQIGTSNNIGSAASAARSDHVHAVTSPVILGLLLTGYTAGSNTPLNSSDTLLQGFENLQAQVSATSGSAITALTGDGTATGPGSVIFTLATVNSNVGSFGSSTTIPSFTVNAKGLITAASSNVVIAPAGTLTGTTLASNVVTSILTSLGTQSQALNMGNYQINDVANPTSNQDAATKYYVDVSAQGIYPQNPIIIANLINDSLSTPPGSPVPFTTTYLIGSSPTGAWASIGAGHFVFYDGSMWHDALGRAVQVGDRLGINLSQAGTLGGNMVGEQNNIATVTNATPGSYSYTFVTPSNRWTVLVNNSLSYDAGNTYYYNEIQWVEITTGFVTNPGLGLSVSGVTWNVNYDNSTIGINGSNQLYVLNNGITNTQLAQAPQYTLKGNNTGATANVTNLTVSQVNTMLGNVTVVGTYNGETANANGATILGNDIYFQSASSTYPGMVDNTVQTFSGNKTFSGQTAVSNTSTTAFTVNSTSLVVDATDNAIGIGVTPQSNSTITTINTSGSAKPIWSFGYGTGSSTGLRGDFARGTPSSPTAAQSGDVLNFFSGRGYGTSQFATTSTGSVSIYAGETFTNTSNATYITFKTTPTGSVASAERMRINSTGNILIDTVTDNGTDALQIGSGLSTSYTKLAGSTSGYIEQQASATTTTYTVTWPAAQGAAGSFLCDSDGAGTLTWSNPISNIDGGNPSSIYTTTAYVNGGTP